MTNQAQLIAKERHAAAEETEHAMLADLHAAAAESLRVRLGLKSATVGGAFVSLVANDPSIVLNRAAGLGLARPATKNDVRQIRDMYDAGGVGRHFVQWHPAARPADPQDLFEAAGYRPQRPWMKFARGRTAVPKLHSELQVRPIGTEQAGDFDRIVAGGFDLTEAGGELLSTLAGRSGWHLYMSFAGDRPVGTGALFVHGTTGWLDWGATAPAYRQQGSQSTLLARRIADALDLGCEALFTTTGAWVEGDPQHSYKNIQRAGFEELFLCDNYAPG